jgi:5-methylcytosine-specific restriction endonuclease McrA
MSREQSKQLRLRLDAAAYRRLHRQVLERDGWRCQNCGSMSNLEVHHMRFRSHSGPDSAENLITLCMACHGKAHGQPHNTYK